MRPLDTKSSTVPPRRPWERPSLREVGTVGEVLEGGEGKASILLADSGDSRKPKGQN